MLRILYSEYYFLFFYYQFPLFIQELKLFFLSPLTVTPLANFSMPFQRHAKRASDFRPRFF